MGHDLPDNEGPVVHNAFQRLDAPGELAASVALDEDGRNRLVVLNLGGVVLGGQLAAHCLVAAMDEHEAREPASLHVLFLAGADPQRHYRAEVLRLRDGRRIAHRQVRLVQGETLVADARAVLRAEAEAGSALPSYPDAMPEVAPPEAMVPRALSAGASRFEQMMIAGQPFVEIRTPAGYRPGTQPRDGARACFWMRVPGSESLASREHHALLAMVSDFWFTLPIHARAPGEVRPSFITSSLDHAVWFHRRPDCGEWMLVETEGFGVHHGLGMVRARYWNRAGEAVATVEQQAMIRG